MFWHRARFRRSIMDKRVCTSKPSCQANNGQTQAEKRHTMSSPAIYIIQVRSLFLSINLCILNSQTSFHIQPNTLSKPILVMKLFFSLLSLLSLALITFAVPINYQGPGAIILFIKPQGCNHNGPKHAPRFPFGTPRHETIWSEPSQQVMQ